MSTVGSSEYGSVMRVLNPWPPETRLALANELIRSCHENDTCSPTRGISAQELAKLLGDGKRVGFPSPDEDTRMLEEALIEKYLK